MSIKTCESRCVVTVLGPIAESVTDAIRTRFDGVAVRTGDRTVVVIDGVDQAAVRAMMILLWDSGHEVVTMELTPTGRAGGP